jgi:hypothetical protein
LPATEIKVDAQKVVALKLHQWLENWDHFSSVKRETQSPGRNIYIFSMKARDLRILSDVFRRRREGDSAEGIQRKRDMSRTSKIKRYVRFGYPYGDLAAPLRNQEHEHLRKPGWLPTAIVINILEPGEVRRGRILDAQHAVTIEDRGGTAVLHVPKLTIIDNKTLPPFEVIDGQHRLWAFDPELAEGGPISDDFELPVVAFRGLGVNWQAYLFWSINVSPKRINRSHAFDLYPLLRTQDWLEQVGELKVYREARAQELTEVLYSYDENPWHHRINMLGERGGGAVSQSAWVRALTTSLLGTGRGQSRPGLFQAQLGDDGEPLGWSRGQQGAFLIRFWADLREAVQAGNYPWISAYRGGPDRAFLDKTSLLNQDMGLRAVLGVLNDVFFRRARQWQLDDWRVEAEDDTDIVEEATLSLAAIDSTAFRRRIRALARELAKFDWRSLDGPGVDSDPAMETFKRSLRGSGGYTALRTAVLKSLSKGNDEVSHAALNLLRTR